MEGPETAASWAADLVLLQQAGVRTVVVHGGGPALTRTMERMGIESRFVDGHRETDAEAAEVAEMVLSGRVEGAETDAQGCCWVNLSILLSVDAEVKTRFTARVALPAHADDNPWARQGDSWQP